MELPNPILNIAPSFTLKKEDELQKVFDFTTKPPQPAPIINPQPPRISVQVACCSVNVHINTDELVKLVNTIVGNKNIIDKDGKRKDIDSGFIRKIENDPDKNSFRNSKEIVYQISEDKILNLKIFGEGKITCSGIKDINDGKLAVELFLSEIAKYPDILTKKEDEIKINDFQVVMLNSSFTFDFEIQNIKLHQVLMKNIDKYKIFIDHDPETHQGVKIHFMWNTNQEEKNGYCVCKKKRCKNKKNSLGDGEGDCKRITLMIFSTGSVNILGARSYEMAHDAYLFLKRVVQENYYDIVKINNINGENIIRKCYGENDVVITKIKKKH